MWMMGKARKQGRRERGDDEEAEMVKRRDRERARDGGREGWRERGRGKKQM